MNPQRQTLDRLPPHSPDAERAVLGCILLDPRQCMGECIERIAQDQAFYDLRHQSVYDALAGMYAENEPIDLVTLHQRLSDRKEIEQIGGIMYLSELPDATASAINISYYLDIVCEKFILRKTIQVCSAVIERVWNHEGEIGPLIDGVERDILAIGQRRAQGEIQSAKELVHKAINTIENYHQDQGRITGITTGFADFDKYTWGLQPADMIVLAARPSIGKTSMAMNIAEHVSVELGFPVGVFSLEMTAEQLMLRMLCSRSRVNLKNVREGFLAERDFPKITNAASKLQGAPIYIDDSSGLSILTLRARARRLFQQFGIRLFIIDYLQLLHSTSRKADNRQQEITDISSGLKGLAKELKAPVLVLSQLNRQIENDKNRKPRMADLRESGALEQDADVIGLLYKGEEKDGAESDGLLIKLLIAKQRNGPSGMDVDLMFRKQYTRFESAAKIETDADYRAPYNE